MPGTHELRIAGITPFSTVDWPGKITATLFLQGCPWDCFYCHNPALIDPRAPGAVAWESVLDLLESRVGLLDGVVFSGGEPTMQRTLGDAMLTVRELGFAVGLHTAGAFPNQLAEVLPLVDWVGLDIKTLRDKYATVTGRRRSGEHAFKALKVVLAERSRRLGGARPLEFEVRTTVHPAAIGEAGLRELGAQLADLGVENWAVQRFRDVGVRTPLPRGAADATAVSLDQLPADRFATLTVR